MEFAHDFAIGFAKQAVCMDSKELGIYYLAIMRP